MNEDTTILPFRQLERINDPLTEIAREGVPRMLVEMLKAERNVSTTLRHLGFEFRLGLAPIALAGWPRQLSGFVVVLGACGRTALAC